jgi:DNA primase
VATSRNDEWSSGREVFSASEVEAVLRALGIEIKEETENDFLSLCPYHGNTDTPAFSTSKRYGYSICFNPSCAKGVDVQLSLERMVRELKGMEQFVAKRFIEAQKQNTGESFKDKFDSISIEDEAELKEFPKEAIDLMHSRLKHHPAALEYLHGRGFSNNTLAAFNVGLALKADKPIYRATDMIVVPAYDHRSRPVGLVGRSLEGKSFKNFGAEPNGTGFHKSKIVWNLQNARKHETIILTESTFDAMRIHQSGYPNVGALLGGSLSQVQKALLSRHFTHAIIFTDNELGDDIVYHKHCAACLKARFDMCQGHKPGRDLGMKIAESLPKMKISWATYDDRHIYARDVKDASDMTDDEIRHCLRNTISHYEYLEWQS